MKSQQIKYLFVGNKTDLSSENLESPISSNSRSSISEHSRSQNSRSSISVNWRSSISDHSRTKIFISAKLNQHIDLLKETLVDSILQGNIQAENTIVTNARHYHALKELSQSLNDIRQGMDNKIPTDLVALDIRRGLHYLGEITGEITNEDQLDYIFSKFCIGK